ncbi:MAG: MFS transporter [Pannonibacter sp.]
MTDASSTPPVRSSAFAPLRQRVFLILWLAMIVGNAGSFIRDTASGWLATDLSPSPAAIAAVQAAATLPVFLLAIPAGVLSDILDRRRLLIVIQVLLGLVSLTLMLLSAAGALTLTGLVALTFFGGMGAALIAPTWQAIVPELVPRSDLRSAVALNSLGLNVARAIGPAAGGLLITFAGATATYAVDVATYGIVIAALVWWPRKGKASDPLAESFGGAFRAGLRYARRSKDLHVVLLSAAVFFLCASAVWALLPLITRDLLQGSSGLYGLLLGAVGLGAIGGALALPTLRLRFNSDNLMLLAALVAASVMIALAAAPQPAIALVLLAVLGAAWITALTTLNGTAQSVLPDWVRGRALAVYLTVFNGAMTAGSLAWGGVAEATGLGTALLLAAAGLVLTGTLFHRLRLPRGEADLTPSNHWPEPLVASPLAEDLTGDAAADRGPVLITIAYKVTAADRAAFLATIHRLSTSRRRDGAYAWGVMEDVADPETLLEWFFVASWAEHLRQHRRVASPDADLQRELLRFHAGDSPPEVNHHLALPPT